jgi:hypothetical protein
MAPVSVCRSLLLAAALLGAPLVQAESAMAFRDAVEASIDEAPADIAAATLAAVALIRGLPEAALPPAVRVASGVAEKLRDPHTRFEGFDLTSFHLGYVGPSRSGKAGRRIVGSLVFADETGRQAEQTYAIDYTFRGGGILIQEAMSVRHPPPRPRVTMYAVPASRVPTDFLHKVRPYGELLAWLADNAIDATNAATAAKGSHYVFAVALDRLGPDDRLILDEGKNVAQTRLDIGGWQIAIRRVESLAGALPLRTAYRPGNFGWTVADVALLPPAGTPTRSAAPRPD